MLKVRRHSSLVIEMLIYIVQGSPLSRFGFQTNQINHWKIAWCSPTTVSSFWAWGHTRSSFYWNVSKSEVYLWAKNLKRGCTFSTLSLHIHPLQGLRWWWSHNIKWSWVPEGLCGAYLCPNCHWNVTCQRQKFYCFKPMWFQGYSLQQLVIHLVSMKLEQWDLGSHEECSIQMW